MKGGTTMISLSEPLKGGFVLRLVVGVTLLVLATAPAGFAADSIALLNAFYKSKMPATQQLRQTYANFTYRPLDRKDLTFHLAIPKNNWRDMPVTLSAETLKEDSLRLISLAKQMAPENEKGEAKIEVVYMRMDLDIGLYDFVDLFLQNFETTFTVLARREGRYNARKVEEVLLRSAQDSKQYIVRVTFSRHDDLFFGVFASALESEFLRFAEPFTVAAVTFERHQKVGQPRGGKMTAFTTKAAPKMAFNCPADWTIEEVPGSVAGLSAVDVKLDLPAGDTQKITTFGYIHARAVANRLGRSPDRILADLKKDLDDMDTPIVYNTCTLKADLRPELAAPLGKLERWDVTINGIANEAAFLVLPKGPASIALALFSVRPEINILAWLHTWQVFEGIAGDLAGAPVHLTKLKNYALPADQQLKMLAAGTMHSFAESVLKGNFDDFYADSSSHFKVQLTPAKLNQAFRGFAAFGELNRLSQHTPVLKEGACLDKKGLLQLNGYCPTQPQATTFRLTYMVEQSKWKLLGIHVAMKKIPSAAVSDPSTPMIQSGAAKVDRLNVLAPENGGRVVFSSSQYNQTTWGPENLIDGQLGSGHGYANQHNKPAEIVFALPAAETLTQFCFNPYTVESSDRWAKNVTIAVSTEGPRKGFAPVGAFTLHNQMDRAKNIPPPDQCFDIAAVQAQYIKLRILSNHGGGGYLELGEFKAYSAGK
jgi:hypothetical protein